MSMSKQDLLAYIELRQSQIEDLENRYGATGVRPAWVGEEIGILLHYQNDAKAELKKLEAKE